MKISTKGRYGLEAIMDLAIYGGHDYVNLKSVSERQGISIKYLEQLFISLKRDGIVESARGARGGYRLIKDSDKITVKQILDCLEGPLALVPCLGENKMDRCQQFEFCVTRILWQKIMNELNADMGSLYLLDIVRLFKEEEIQPNSL